MASSPRRFLIVLVVVIVPLLAVVALQAWRNQPRRERTDELGTVWVYPSWWWLRGVVFLFSSSQGWNDADAAAAHALARRGYHVFGIDTRAFLASKKAGQDCVFLPSMLENFSRKMEYRLGAREYRLPMLAGHEAGASLVYMAHLQSPPLSFAAAVALNPSPTLQFHRPFCNHAPRAQTSDRQLISIGPINAAVPLRIWADDAATPEQQAFAREADGQRPAFASNAHSLRRAYLQALRDIRKESARNGIGDLPLVEINPQHATNPAFAIVYSGDGGWRDLDKRLAGVLASKGMPVVGVDVLGYYWHDKPPDQAAADLERIIRYYSDRWGRKRVVLIGFSFGANVLPFLYNRLPADVQAQVRLISLLSPERTTAFSVDPTEWVHLKSKRATIEIAPELQRMPASLVQCVYGKEEGAESLCTLPAAARTQVLRKPGGHHFDENYERLADEVLAAVM